MNLDHRRKEKDEDLEIAAAHERRELHGRAKKKVQSGIFWEDDKEKEMMKELIRKKRQGMFNGVS